MDVCGHDLETFCRVEDRRLVGERTGGRQGTERAVGNGRARSLNGRGYAQLRGFGFYLRPSLTPKTELIFASADQEATTSTGRYYFHRQRSTPTYSLGNKDIVMGCIIIAFLDSLVKDHSLPCITDLYRRHRRP